MKNYSIKVLFQVLNGATSPLRKIGSSVSRVTVDLQKMSKVMDTHGKKMKLFGKNMSSLGSSMSQKITLPLLGIGAAAIKVAGDFELLEADFTTMLGGSAEKAKELTEAIKTMGAATPFQVMDLAKNVKMLMQYEMSSKDALKNIHRLGDISGGSKERLASLSLAFAQSASAGKLMGGDFRQMVNAGFNPLMEMSKKTGKSITVLRKEMSAGKISFKDLEESITSATSKGGLFYKSMDRASKTIPGLVSTMQDAFTNLLGEMGLVIKDSLSLGKVIPALGKKIASITKKIKSFAKTNPKITKMIVLFLLLAAAIGPILFAVGSLMSIWGTMSVAFAVFTGTILPFLITLWHGVATALWGVVVAGGPILWTIMALVGAAILIYKFWDPIKSFFVDSWVYIQKLFKKHTKTMIAVVTILGLAFLPITLVIGGIYLLIKAIGWLSENWEYAWKSALKFLKPLAPLLRPGIIMFKYFMKRVRALAPVFDYIKKKFFAFVSILGKGWDSVKKFFDVSDITLDSEVNVNKNLKIAKGSLKNMTENSTEITLKVEATEGSEASVEKVKNLKGRPRVKIGSKKKLGLSYATG